MDEKLIEKVASELHSHAYEAIKQDKRTIYGAKEVVELDESAAREIIALIDQHWGKEETWWIADPKKLFGLEPRCLYIHGHAWPSLEDAKKMEPLVKKFIPIRIPRQLSEREQLVEETKKKMQYWAEPGGIGTTAKDLLERWLKLEAENDGC